MDLYPFILILPEHSISLKSEPEMPVFWSPSSNSTPKEPVYDYFLFFGKFHSN